MRALAAGSLVLALLGGGCSTGAPGPADAQRTPLASPPSRSPGVPTGTPAASPDGTAAPRSTPSVPGPPPARDDRPAREAFAEYALQAWIHALNTNDPGPLLALSGARPCDGCRQLAAELRERAKEGWYVDLRDVRVWSARSVGEGRTTRVVLAVSLPESATYFLDGSFRSTNPAHPRSTFDVEMTFTGKRFRLDAFSLY